MPIQQEPIAPFKVGDVVKCLDIPMHIIKQYEWGKHPGAGFKTGLVFKIKDKPLYNNGRWVFYGAYRGNGVYHEFLEKIHKPTILNGDLYS
jgi:hypothetical protein